MRRFAVLLPLLLSACSRTKAADIADASPAAASSAALVAELDPEGLVRAWSEALDRHDLVALEKLYADEVFFYTAKRSRADVMKAKASALGAGSTFHQTIIGTIEISDEGKRATFTKRSGTGPKLASSKAVLAFGGKPLRITEERDAVKPKGTCDEVASRIAWAHPHTKKILAGLEKELAKHPDRRLGGMGEAALDDGVTSGTIGVHHPDRFESIIFYIVEDGVLRISSASDEDAFPIKAADAAEIKAACP